MSDSGVFDSWYREHLGEPVESDHVYGYWAFLLGAAMTLVALALFLVAATYQPGSDAALLNRQVAFTLVLLAGPVIGLSVVYLLPLQARAVRVALAGLVICALATVAFNTYYPGSWNFGTVDRSGPVMAVYGAGIALQILTIFAYPLLSTETAQPAAAADAAGSEATFQLFEDRGGEHRWRLVHGDGDVIADSAEGYASRQEARQGMQSVQRNALGADEDVLESPPASAATSGSRSGSERSNAAAGGATASGAATGAASEAATDAASGAATDVASDPPDDGETAEPDSAAQFEVYKDRGGKWRWRLRHRNGNVVADSGQGYSARSAVEDAVERVQSVAEGADSLAYDPAGFECYRDEAGEWRWRLRHGNGNVLADSGEGYASRSNAHDGMARVREYATDAENFEIYEDQAGKYRWRLTASNGEVVADGGQGYASEAGAREGVERVRNYAPLADTLEYDPAGFECYQDAADEWRWRLRHRNGQIIADSGEGYASRQKARQGLQSVQTNAPGAAVVEPDG